MSSLPNILKEYLSGGDFVRHNRYLLELSDNTIIHKRRPQVKRHVVLVTGPSGAGKDTIINRLPAEHFVRWRTWTTRTEVRADELEEDPYVRVSVQEFEDEEKRGNFIETNLYAGERYGTHIREAEAAFADGRIPVLRIDPRGALTFNKMFEDRLGPFYEADLHHFYVVPPSLRQILARLRKRDKDPALVSKRYQAAMADLPFLVNAHYILINYSREVGKVVSALVAHLETFYS